MATKSNFEEDFDEMEFLSGNSPTPELTRTSNESANGTYARTRKNLVQKFKCVEEAKNIKLPNEGVANSKTNKNISTINSSKNLMKKINSNSLNIKISPSVYSTKLISNNSGGSFLNEMVKKYGSSHNLSTSYSKYDGSKSTSPETENLNKSEKSSSISKKNSNFSVADNKSRMISEKLSHYDSNSKATFNMPINAKQPKRLPKKRQLKETVPVENIDVAENNCKRKSPRKKTLPAITYETTEKVKNNECSTVGQNKIDYNTSKSKTNGTTVQENALQITEKEIASFFDAELVKDTPDLSSVSDKSPVNSNNRDIQVNNLNEPVPNNPSAGILSPESLTCVTQPQPPILLTSPVSNTINPYITHGINNGFLYFHPVPSYQPAITNTIQASNANTVSNFSPLIGNGLTSFSSPVSTPNPTNIYVVKVPCCHNNINSSNSHSSTAADINSFPIIQLIVNNPTEVPTILNSIFENVRNPPGNIQKSISQSMSQPVDNSCEKTNSPSYEETLIVQDIAIPSSKENPHINADKHDSLKGTSIIPADLTGCVSTSEAERAGILQVEIALKNCHFFTFLHETKKEQNNKTISQCKLEANKIYELIMHYRHFYYLDHFYRNIDVSAFLSSFYTSIKKRGSFKNAAFKYKKNFVYASNLGDVIKDYVGFHLSAILKVIPQYQFPIKLSLLLKRNHSKLIPVEKAIMLKLFSSIPELSINDVVFGLNFVGLITILVEHNLDLKKKGNIKGIVE